MRLGVVNSVASNGGDLAILRGLLGRVRRSRPDLEATVFDRDAATVGRSNPDLAVRPSAAVPPSHPSPTRRALQRVRWQAASGRHRQAYGEVDAFASTGGTYLVEHYDLRPRWREFELVRATGRPYVLLTQSLGPFADPENRSQLRRVVEGAELVLLRDERSVAHVHDVVGDPGNLQQGADLAFALPPPPLGDDPDDTLIVSVRAWPAAPPDARRRYREGIERAVIAAVRDHDLDVVFLSTCQGLATYRFDDSRTATEVVAGLPPDVARRCTVDREFRGPEAFVASVARARHLLATRMHAAILALVAGTPVTAIAYEWKTEELFGGLDLSDHVVAYGAPPGEVVARLGEGLGDGDLRASIPGRVAPYRAMAERDIDTALGRLERAATGGIRA
jgi:colanic acid/amylovoran biosynthesis protein